MKSDPGSSSAGRETLRRARSLAVAAFFAGAVSIAACGGDSGSTGTPGPVTYSTPAGSYDISTVNAKPLPVAIFADSGYTYEVISGALMLTTDGKYSTKLTYRQTVPGNVSSFIDSTGGTWTLLGTSIQFTNSQDASTDKAVWDNTGKLTFTETDGPATNTYLYVIRKP